MRYFKQSIFLILLILSLLLKVHPQSLEVNTSSNLLLDSYGRVRVFHGVNVVYKPSPFYPPDLDSFTPETSFCEEDAQNLISWGLNLIRLYISWEGVEPKRGVYNTTYLEQVQKVIRIASKYNISVLLDAHQDLYSRIYCGEGFPDWAITSNKSFPQPFDLNFTYDQQGYPLLSQCLEKPFFTYYFTYDLGQSSQNFFTNKENLADSFAEFWKKVAQFFLNETNVIGYEIINEPTGISPYDHPFDYWWPGEQNNKYLLPFYQKVNEKIREVDSNRLVFFEPALFDMFFSGGFKTNVGGPKYKNKEVFSFHIYCGVQNSLGEPLYPPLCNFLDKHFFSGKVRNIQSLQIGGILSEFGANSDTEEATKEMKQVFQMAEKQFFSWTYWQFKSYNDFTTQAAPGTEGFYDSQGNLWNRKVSTLAHPYATVICGQPVSENFDYEKNIFNFSFYFRGQCTDNQRTVISLSQKFYYTKGFNYKFQNCDKCTLEKDTNTYFTKGYYSLQIPETIQNGSLIILTVF